LKGLAFLHQVWQKYGWGNNLAIYTVSTKFSFKPNNMKAVATRILLIAVFISHTLISSAITRPPVSINPGTIESVCKRLAAMKAKDFEKMVGHKLSLKDRVAFFAIKAKARHYIRKGVPESDMQMFTKMLAAGPTLAKKADEPSSAGQSAMIIGIAAAALLVLAFFVPYVIFGSLVASIIAIVMGSSAYKKDRSDRKAMVGKLLGWITLGLIAILIIAVAIIVSSAWYW
jgi:hypothetical protein